VLQHHTPHCGRYLVNTRTLHLERFENDILINYFQFFSLFNENWLKGRPCSYGITVHTKSGPIIGKTFTLPPDEKKVHAFLGIPYATAGTFKQRFKVNNFFFEFLKFILYFIEASSHYKME
jgi:hypothetical protein